MTAIPGLRAVHITLIKRYRFPEPVFFAKHLRTGRLWSGRLSPRVLSDSKKIGVLLNRHRQFDIGDGITLKPVRNPNTRKEFYWAPFKPQAAPLDMGLPRPLPMLPFQALFRETKLIVDKSVIQSHMGTVEDFKVTFDAWLYTPGVVTLHLYAYIRVPEGQLDPLKILNLTLDLNSIPLEALSRKGSRKFAGVFSFLDYLTNLLFKRLLTRQPLGGESEGYYVVYNLQADAVEGDTPPWRDHVEDLAKLLARSQQPGHEQLRRLVDKVQRGIGSGRSEDDLIAIDRQASIFFTDIGIRKKYAVPSRAGVVEARRCFRHHFVSSVELAYISPTLIAEYKAMFDQILGQLEAAPLGTTLRALLKRAVTFGALKPIAYVTVRDSLFTVDRKLKASRRDGFWEDAYLRAASATGVREEVQDLEATTQSVFDLSSRHAERRFDQLKTVSKGIADAAIRVLNVIRPGI